MNGPIAANVIFFLLMCVKCLLMLSLTHFLGHDTHRHTHTHARTHACTHTDTNPHTHPPTHTPHPLIHTPTSTHTHTHTRSFFDTDTYTEKKFKNRTSSFHGQNFLRSKGCLPGSLNLSKTISLFLDGITSLVPDSRTGLSPHQTTYL